MNRVLVLHTSIGHGIKVTAQNIYQTLAKSGRFEVNIEDFHEVESGRAVQILEKIYLAFTEIFPFVWGWLYSDLVARITIPFRMLAASFRYKRILSLITKFNPNIVVSTETVPSGVVAYLKRKKMYSGKLVIVFSDYHLHRFWLYDEADLYLCVTREQAEALKTLGVAKEKIALTGMIVAEKYLQTIPRVEAVKTLGLDPDIPVILISGGRRGLMTSRQIAQKLLENPDPLQIIIVTGLNTELKRNLLELPTPTKHNVQILNYVQNQEILMSTASVIISKPGGPTIAEAVGKGLPVVVTDAHPGHETLNMEYLVRHGIAWYAKTPNEAASLTKKILAGELKYDSKQAYEKIIEPSGGVSVVEALSHLPVRNNNL